jgi:hypothetical protein
VGERFKGIGSNWLEALDEGLKNMNQASNALWMALAMALVKSGNLSKAEIVQAIDLTADRFRLEGEALGMVEGIRDVLKTQVSAGPKD